MRRFTTTYKLHLDWVVKCFYHDILLSKNMEQLYGDKTSFFFLTLRTPRNLPCPSFSLLIPIAFNLSFLWTSPCNFSLGWCRFWQLECPSSTCLNSIHHSGPSSLPYSVSWHTSPCSVNPEPMIIPFKAIQHKKRATLLCSLFQYVHPVLSP